MCIMKIIISLKIHCRVLIHHLLQLNGLFSLVKLKTVESWLHAPERKYDFERFQSGVTPVSCTTMKTRPTGLMLTCYTL